jgi:hypothetical protein
MTRESRSSLLRRPFAGVAGTAKDLDGAAGRGEGGLGAEILGQRQEDRGVVAGAAVEERGHFEHQRTQHLGSGAHHGQLAADVGVAGDRDRGLVGRAALGALLRVALGDAAGGLRDAKALAGGLQAHQLDHGEHLRHPAAGLAQQDSLGSSNESAQVGEPCRPSFSSIRVTVTPLALPSSRRFGTRKSERPRVLSSVGRCAPAGSGRSARPCRGRRS